MSSPWSDPEMFVQALERLGALEDVIGDLDNPVIRDLREPSFLTKGTTRTVPLDLNGNSKGPRIPSLYHSDPEYLRTIQQQATAARAERQIARASALLHGDLTEEALDELIKPRNPGWAPPSDSKPRVPAARLAGIAGLLLELLTRSGELNTNETEELKRRRASGRPEID